MNGKMRRRGHILILTLVLAMSSLAQANSFLEQSKYNEVLRLKNVEGKNDAALTLARELEKQIDSGSALDDQLQTTINDLTGGKNPEFDLEKAIKFVTGTKTEIYCREKGLVELLIKHNDSTESKVVLIKNNRKLESGSYSVMLSGDYVYELKNAYRGEAVRSDLIVGGSSSDYKVLEVRERADDNRPDRGSYVGRWNGKNSTTSYTTKGEVKEPAPVYMASDYHLFGAQDFGYRIQFKSGSVDKTKATEGGAPKDIVVKTTRTVGQRLVEYSTIDSKGNVYNYADCYPVTYLIELDQLKEPRTN